jgi:octopine/nopaline transport system substrate-binding protein
VLRADQIAPLALALYLAFLPAAALAKTWTEVRIATEGAYPPWNDIDGSGQLIGFEIDLAHDLCRRMGVTCAIAAKDWDRLIPGLEANDYDAIMDGIAITEARRQVIQFSDSYAQTPAVFAVFKDSALATPASLSSRRDRLDLNQVSPGEQSALDALREAFAGKRVGVEVASPAARFLQTFMADTVESREYTTLEGLDLDLAAKRIDLALASMSHWRPLLATQGGKDFTLIGPDLTGGPFGPGVGIGLRPSDGDLAEPFNRAIAAARADGTIARLAQQWFGYDASP